MSSDIAIKVENLSKSYQIYNQPHDRLKQFIIPRVQHLFGYQPSRFYRDFWALKDVSFDVKKGETVGIIGRNGSGKSTLLQIITGTLSPTSGTVTTDGRIAALLELGSGFNLEFTGRENVYLNGALLGLSSAQIDDRFDAIAAFADIGDHLDQPVKTYSSGMLVRLAFAVQVQVEPDILVIDEALAVGDALFQKRCFRRIETLVSDGTTLLFVSHDQESVRTLTSRALLLHKGHTLHWGTSAEAVLGYRRLLHEEEAAYYTDLTTDLAARAALKSVPSGNPGVTPERQEEDRGSAADRMVASTESLSFGDGEVTILKVETLDANTHKCALFRPGDLLRIRITCEAHHFIDKLNVGIRLRNKEGVKIYSWGTLNQDMNNRSRNTASRLFWARQFGPGERFSVVLECPCVLGDNLYEIQASVSQEATLNYSSQRILHWVDEAAFFQVSLQRDQYFFGGVIDLQMSALW